jgi:hypothetical protein
MSLNSRIAVIVALTVGAACGFVDAQETPTTNPAAPVAVDPSTPRGALKALTAALDAGDVDATRALLLAENPQERSWADAMSAFSRSLARLRAQAVESFGAEGARAVVGDSEAATAAAMRQIDDSTEELDGERATVRSAVPEDRPLALRKAAGGSGRWVVPVTTITGGGSPEEFAQVADRLRRQAAAVDSVSADIVSGKLSTPEQAAQALQRRQLEARMKDDPPAPATTSPSPSTQRSDA